MSLGGLLEGFCDALFLPGNEYRESVQTRVFRKGVKIKKDLNCPSAGHFSGAPRSAIQCLK